MAISAPFPRNISKENVTFGKGGCKRAVFPVAALQHSGRNAAAMSASVPADKSRQLTALGLAVQIVCKTWK